MGMFLPPFLTSMVHCQKTSGHKWKKKKTSKLTASFLIAQQLSNNGEICFGWSTNIPPSILIPFPHSLQFFSWPLIDVNMKILRQKTRNMSWVFLVLQASDKDQSQQLHTLSPILLIWIQRKQNLFGVIRKTTLFLTQNDQDPTTY